jgi:hypothetical protein
VAVHIYTQTRQNNTNNNRTTQITNSAGHAPSLQVFTLAFTLQLRKKHWLACHCQGVGFNTRPVSVGFVMDEVALGQVFLQVLLFLRVGDIPPMLHTLIHPYILNGM